MKVFLCLVVLMLSASSALGRVFSKCELAQELEKLGFPRDSLPDWVCLVNSESSFNSTAIGGPNTDNSFDWGLFQINDRYWCLVGSVGNDCNANCYDFVDDDITNDVACVQLIFARHGFTAWHGWTAQCQGEELPSVDECF